MNITVKIATNEEKSAALAVRKKVFVEEQRVPMDIEVDEHDDTALHFIAYVDGQIAGTARLRWIDRFTAKAERVAVLAPYRGYGVGKALMHALENEAKHRQVSSIVIHAQVQARPFYEQLDYQAYGETFFDAKIEHIAMKKEL